MFFLVLKEKLNLLYSYVSIFLDFCPRAYFRENDRRCRYIHVYIYHIYMVQQHSRLSNELWIYIFPICTTTNYLKLGSFKQYKFNLLQFWRSEAWNESHRLNSRCGQCWFIPEAPPQNLCLVSSGFWRPPALFGSWPYCLTPASGPIILSLTTRSGILTSSYKDPCDYTRSIRIIPNDLCFSKSWP